MLVLFIVLLLCAVGIECEMKGKIVNGDRADISSFAYSAFLLLRSRDQNFLCGASIINQKILLTAAHCCEDCSIKRCNNSNAFIGNEDRKKGVKIPLDRCQMHENYVSNVPINDIALITVKGNLKLGDFVKRVAILNKPPNFKVAAVAGWGYIDEFQNISTHYLHSTEQRIWPLKECRRVIKTAPHSTFCAGELHGHQYPAWGDSGSAIVADGYIQLGIVSFKIHEITPSLVFYTDVSLFYEWIKKTSKSLYCSTKSIEKQPNTH